MKRGVWIMAAVIIFWCTALFARAEDPALGEEMDAYDFSEIEQVLEKEEVELSFGEVVYELLTGDTDQMFRMLLKEAAEYLWDEIEKNKEGVLQVFMIAAAGALFSNFAAIFQESQDRPDRFFYYVSDDAFHSGRFLWTGRADSGGHDPGCCWNL